MYASRSRALVALCVWLRFSVLLTLFVPVALLWAAIAGGMASLFVPVMALAVAAAASVAVGVLLAQRLQSRPAGRAASGLDALQQVCELVVYLAVLATLAQG